MDNTADVIIIGGGVNGASLAFHLAQRGLKALILEKRFLAAEATGHSSGLVRMHYDLEAESRLAWASFQYFRNWPQMVGGDCGFTRTGFIQIVRPEYEDALRENVKMHQRIGIPTFLITSDDVRRLAPGFVSADFSIAAYEPESGYADPSSTARSLIDVARQKGANLIQDCRVTGIKTEGGRVSGVESSQGDFFAPLIVNAGGAWAAQIGRMAGLDVPVESWRHETLFIRRPPELGPSHPTVIDDALSMYFRPETGGLTLVGLEDSNVIGEIPENGSDRARSGFVERAVERICRRIPAMEKGSLHSTLAGYDGITPDQRAILGPAGPEGFYLACGFSGTGFKIAPAVGACMAELILDGQARSVDISPFRYQRFAEGGLLAGEHAYEDIWR
jgi:sarcosine oxidase, subunit beta